MYRRCGERMSCHLRSVSESSRSYTLRSLAGLHNSPFPEEFNVLFCKTGLLI